MPHSAGGGRGQGGCHVTSTYLVDALQSVHSSRAREVHDPRAIAGFVPVNSAFMHTVTVSVAYETSLRQITLEQSLCISHISSVTYGFPAASYKTFSLPYLTLRVVDRAVTLLFRPHLKC